MGSSRAVALVITAVALWLTASAVVAELAPASPVRHVHRRRASSARAPSGPPLAGSGAVPREEAEQTVGIPSAAGDQLVENGLASPLCKGSAASSLSSEARADCASSGFVAAVAASNDYALDVHIDTGTFGLSKGGLLSVVQDMLIAPLWGTLLWLVHALVAMLEWCYTLELLGGASTTTVAHTLLRARAEFTEPWLALVLALASLLALYHGIVRRRVADTLGGALTMLAMMAGGLWIIADPAGTVGVVGAWADQASLGTLATSASGSPDDGAATLAQSMRALYATAIETPWCYLEFGNVRWCSDPSQFEPGLHAAAVALIGSGKQGSSAPAPQAAQIVRGATSNGALFLAFPANGPQRNSINEQGSLLRAICRSEEATKCVGSDAPEAEFRTDAGTFPRLFGLFAIAAGVLGMALLFGLLALRLLTASFVGLFLLLLAPLAVLAPAFGDGGRSLFSAWLTRLLAAVTSKLLFSFVLGALLTMQRTLTALDTLGWWTQWLLVSGFWWTLFVKRQELAAMVRAAGRQQGSAAFGGVVSRVASRHSSGGTQGQVAPLRPLRHAESALQVYGAVRHPIRWAGTQAAARTGPKPPQKPPPTAGAPAPGALSWRSPTERLRGGLHRAFGGRDGRRPGDRSKVPDRSRKLAASLTPVEPPVAAVAATGVSSPASQPSPPAEESPPASQPPSPPPRAVRGQRSPVSEDALAVAHGRKRRLGYRIDDKEG